MLRQGAGDGLFLEGDFCSLCRCWEASQFGTYSVFSPVDLAEVAIWSDEVFKREFVAEVLKTESELDT